MQGIIIKQISNLYTVKCDDIKVDCQAIGKFRYEKITPLVGDYVVINPDDKQITKILPRKNELNRPNIANVDRALIITSVKEPKLSLTLLDKMLSLVIYHGIKPIICLTKIDLLDISESNEIMLLKKYYEKIGIKVLFNMEKLKLKKLLNNKTVVLVGQSGAGKSSLLNSLKKELNIETKPISKSLGRGVHTTRHTELYEIGNILLADTPGFSSLTFENIKKEDIKETFLEFKNNDCRYNNCMHINEQDCFIKRQVDEGKILYSRYESYLKIVGEAQK